MDMSGPVAIFLFFLLLLVDMFFYGFDAAIDNLNEKEILHKAEEEKDRRSMRLSEMISRPGFYINTVQLVITLINILMGAFYLNIWLQTIDKGLHVINVGGMSLENVFYCHDLYPVDFRCADSPENGIQTAGEVGVCLY